ncbi:hypothetical protein ACJJIK_18895 [Microbulbifer sp. ZKSA006]|uniref:hypothetical protein n=1 Tax=Microbulbifer sp. ZKSA006 TaxID=3243390 RepID=UPI0040395310
MKNKIRIISTQRVYSAMLNRLFASRRRPYIPHRNKREAISIDFSGNRLELSLPPHSCYDSFADLDPTSYPERVNIFDPSDYIADSGYEDWEREGVSRQCFIERSWELFGPIWHSRPIGTIDFRLILNRHDKLPSDMSCLNPQHLEQVVMRRLYYSGPCRPDYYVQLAPVNWKLYELSGVTAIFFEEHRVNPPGRIEAQPPSRHLLFQQLIYTVKQRALSEHCF